jgi:hypothetical protein
MLMNCILNKNYFRQKAADLMDKYYHASLQGPQAHVGSVRSGLNAGIRLQNYAVSQQGRPQIRAVRPSRIYALYATPWP